MWCLVVFVVEFWCVGGVGVVVGYVDGFVDFFVGFVCVGCVGVFYVDFCDWGDLCGDLFVG